MAQGRPLSSIPSTTHTHKNCSKTYIHIYDPTQIKLGIFSRKEYLRAGDMAQVVGSLPNTCEVLSSNPSTAKKRKET
jgi:hypothetical protein